MNDHAHDSPPVTPCANSSRCARISVYILPRPCTRISDFGWREVVTEHGLDIEQGFLVGGQGNRLQIGRLRFGATREPFKGDKSLIQSAAKFSGCYLAVNTGCL